MNTVKPAEGKKKAVSINGLPYFTGLPYLHNGYLPFAGYGKCSGLPPSPLDLKGADGKERCLNINVAWLLLPSIIRPKA